MYGLFTNVGTSRLGAEVLALNPLVIVKLVMSVIFALEAGASASAAAADTEYGPSRAAKVPLRFCLFIFIAVRCLIELLLRFYLTSLHNRPAPPHLSHASGAQGQKGEPGKTGG